MRNTKKKKKENCARYKKKGNEIVTDFGMKTRYENASIVPVRDGSPTRLTMTPNRTEPAKRGSKSYAH
jgi:hypothetical protein